MSTIERLEKMANVLSRLAEELPPDDFDALIGDLEFVLEEMKGMKTASYLLQ